MAAVNGIPKRPAESSSTPARVWCRSATQEGTYIPRSGSRRHIGAPGGRIYGKVSMVVNIA